MHTATIHHPFRSAHPIRWRWVVAAIGVTALSGAAVIAAVDRTGSDAPQGPIPAVGRADLEGAYTVEELTAGLTQMVAATIGITLATEPAPTASLDSGADVPEPPAGQVPAGTFADLQSGATGLPLPAVDLGADVGPSTP